MDGNDLSSCLAEKVLMLMRISAIVVTFNEDKHLSDCLSSLKFCDEILVFDLGSTDKSIEIAKSLGAKVINHEKKPIVEEIRSDAIGYAKNDWIIFLDPDEIFPDIYDSLCSLIVDTPDLGGIRIPLQYYFMGKKLTATVWGMPKHMLRVLHKERIVLNQKIHKSISVQQPYADAKINIHGDNFIKHYWVDSYKKMIEKHYRYIVVEGEAKYRNGERFSWLKCIKESARGLKNNLINYRGWRGGWAGWFLSFFYAWYVWMCFISLRRFEVTNSFDNNAHTGN